jgi:hypothetical protein
MEHAVKVWTIVVLLAVFGGCISCHESVVADTDPTGWNAPVTITYANSDTVSLRKASLVLRYGGEANAGGVVVEAHSPSGAMARDTVAVTLAPNKASNNIQELSVEYRRGVMFGEVGVYSFTLTPTAEIRGVWSVGINME